MYRLFLILALSLSLQAQTKKLPYRAGATPPVVTVDPTWTSTSAIFPEGSTPTLSESQTYTNEYGNTVVRITDSTTASGLSFSPYYVDRSALNANSTYLMMISGGGQWWVRPTNATTGVPTGAVWEVGATSGAPVTLNPGYWHPTDPDIYFVSSDTKLYKFRVSTKTWTLLKDFTGIFTGLAPDYPGNGYIMLQGLSSDGNKFAFDFRTQTKVAWGILEYTLDTNVYKWSPGKVMVAPNPQPNSTFRSNGLGAVDKSFEYFIVQESGTPSGELTPTGLSSSYSYVVPEGQTNHMGAGTSISGDFQAAHGAMITRGQVRVAAFEHGYYTGLLPNGSPDYLDTLRITDFTQPTLAAGPPYYGQYPGGSNGLPRDIFAWHISTQMTGAHLSSNTIGSDSWVCLSLYQEVSGTRNVGVFTHEIILVNTTGAISVTQGVSLNNNGTIRRIAHHYSDGSKGVGDPLYYWAQPHATLSLDKKWIVFGSSWGQTTRYDTFMVRVPADLTWN